MVFTGRKPLSQSSLQADFRQATPERSEQTVESGVAATGGEICQKEPRSEMLGSCAVPKTSSLWTEAIRELKDRRSFHNITAA